MDRFWRQSDSHPQPIHEWSKAWGDGNGVWRRCSALVSWKIGNDPFLFWKSWKSFSRNSLEQPKQTHFMNSGSLCFKMIAYRSILKSLLHNQYHWRMSWMKWLWKASSIAWSQKSKLRLGSYNPTTWVTQKIEDRREVMGPTYKPMGGFPLASKKMCGTNIPSRHSWSDFKASPSTANLNEKVRKLSNPKLQKKWEKGLCNAMKNGHPGTTAWRKS